MNLHSLTFRRALPILKLISRIGVLRWLMLFLSIWMLSGCAYYNTFYNAKQFYQDAEKERKKRQRTQVVELSPEEKVQAQKQGLSTESDADKPSSVEMQNYQKAIEKASSVLEFYPKSRWVDDALMMVGECFYYRHEYAKSLRKFEEIMRLYPQSSFIPEAQLITAKNFLGLREFDRAEQKFRDIALDKKMPKNIRQEAEYELAGLYFVKESFDQAAEEYRRVSHDSDDKMIRAMSHYRLGECLVSLHQYDDAPAVFRRAMDESPNEDFKSQVTFKYGESLNLVGKFDQAIRVFSNLLAKELEVRRIPMIKLQLANNLRLNGDLDAALKWYRNIIQDHKNTDASAKSYFALGDIEEKINGDYKKAQENYELVRGEFANSSIAPEAKMRADNIKLMLDLQKSINELLGVATASDSLQNGEGANKKAKKVETDDASIDLGRDGMWINYSGRNRPEPKSITGMEEETPVAHHAEAPGADSTAAGVAKTEAVPDSMQKAQQAEKEKRQKIITLTEKQMALAELLLFQFNKADSALNLYRRVIDNQPDSVLTARAYYSTAYILSDIKKDTTAADSVLKQLIERYPNSLHAEGARKKLGLPLRSEQIDTAGVVFRQAELIFYTERDTSRAMDLLATIPVEYPASPFAIKAAYTMGWIQEQRGNLKQALEMYKKIVADSPNSEVGKKLAQRLNAHERAIKQEEERTKALADSLAKVEKLAQAALDSLKKSVADSSARAGAPAAIAPADSAASSAAASVAVKPDSSKLAADSLRAAASGSVTPGVVPPPAAFHAGTDSLLEQQRENRRPPGGKESRKPPKQGSKPVF